MHKRQPPSFRLLLMLLSLSSLNSCVTKNSDYCPVWPIAGVKVAAEIEQFEGQAFWEWMARLNKLRQQLELCSQ